jgi:hypothetical protein
MKSINRQSLFFGICFLLFINSSFGQKLSLDEILTAYKLDSVSLRTFCNEKHFELTKVKEDNWIFSYTYQSTIDKKVSFIRTFPKDQSDKVFLYYYFDERKDYKNFKDSLKIKGFDKSKSYEMFPNNQNMSDYRERYITDNLELELCTTNFGGNRRTLLLYKRVNF